MKLLCIILISFALVNVLVALDDYENLVCITNQHMFNTRAYLPKVIENIVLYGGYTIVELGLMFAVPEAEDKDVEDYINKQKIEYQVTAQEKIWCLTLTGAPQINAGEFSNVTLKDLGNRRRVITLEAIQVLIRAVLRGNNRNFDNFYDLCRLIGLLRSIKNPGSFIVLADLDPKDARVCDLVDMNRGVSFYYNIEGNIWEYDDKGIPKELLFSQVQ
ncbi:uncharacterized protein LOC126840095 [Adelges cooleyi]|uniref:uncharacterized protein LOC126840095 n=1 Tax=Adelges cooleyi TaxID=133065 RepID=UPI00217FE1A0|nr:uncharacterized protein LOC126840095 [Adelges cooleyi]XP_050431552.1 uncharacterized protein LOC126840095 [Adelges cooleyi]XP_050431553.1 uncharacterized protein LOC126840095 [Adelges cooleyi]